MMRENLRVDKAKKNQIPQIVELVRNSFDEAYLIPSIYRGVGVEKYLECEFNNPKSPYYYFIVMSNNQLVGYCELKSFYPNVFLNIITVDKSFKGRGIGSFMMDYLISFFKSIGYDAILLDVFKSNKVANDWYEKNCFRLESLKHFFKFTGDCYDDDIPCQILNYPQVQIEKENYGFSILKVMANNEIYEYGVINKTLILRNEYSSNAVKLGCNLIHSLQMDDLYIYSNDKIKEKDSTLAIIDCIYRKKLKL